MVSLSLLYVWMDSYIDKCEFVSLPQCEIQYMDMIREQGEYCTLTYKIIRISFKAIYTGIVAGLMKGMCVAFLRLVLSMCIDVSQV